jgi:hypothetical protein
MKRRCYNLKEYRYKRLSSLQEELQTQKRSARTNGHCGLQRSFLKRETCLQKRCSEIRLLRSSGGAVTLPVQRPRMLAAVQCCVQLLCRATRTVGRVSVVDIICFICVECNRQNVAPHKLTLGKFGYLSILHTHLIKKPGLSATCHQSFFLAQVRRRWAGFTGTPGVPVSHRY